MELLGFVLLVLVVFLIVGLVTGNLFYVVKQQHAVIIERLGKFHRIVGAGFHAKIPFVDRKAATVSLRTMKNGFNIDVKTQDNVTIGLEGWRTGDSKSAVTDVTGKVVEITREDYCSVTLNCEGEGVVGTHGVTIGGTLYGAGQSMSVYFNDCKLFLRVQSIEVIE